MIQRFTDWVRNGWNRTRGLVGYIRTRLGERSTYMGMTGIIAGASVIPAPWCYWSIAMGVLGMLIPDGKPA